MEEKLKKILPWIPLIIAGGYFTYLFLTWTSYLRFQTEIKQNVDAKLDEWLAQHPLPKTDES